MTDREKLILHLQTLAKNNTKNATLDVNFLLGVLNALPKEQTKPSLQKFDKLGVDVDGGHFYDSD
jgi:hypothetical protein